MRVNVEHGYTYRLPSGIEVPELDDGSAVSRGGFAVERAGHFLTVSARIPNSSYSVGIEASYPQALWQRVVANDFESLRDLGPWHFDLLNSGPRVTLLSLATNEPVRVAGNRTVANALRRELARFERDAMYLHLRSPVGLDDVRTATAYAKASGRHVVLASSLPMMGHEAHYLEAGENGLYLVLPRATPESLDALATQWARASTTDYLGPVYATRLEPEQPDVTPLVAWRFEHLTVLLGINDEAQAAFAMNQVFENADIDVQAWIRGRDARRLDLSLRRMAEARRQEAQDGLRRHQRSRDAALNQYLEANRNLVAAQAVLASDGAASATDQRGAEMLKRMIERGTVSEVNLTPDMLTFKTQHIYHQDPRSGVWHDIGKFQVTMHLSTGRFVFTNVTRTLPVGWGRHHPHVSTGGEPCLGSLAEAMPPLLASGDWPTMMELGLLYLESSNIDDGACNLHLWPVVVNPEAVGLSPHQSNRPTNGLPMPEVPEGDEDFGAYGAHCFVRRSGEYHYHIGNNAYINDGGTTVSHPHERLSSSSYEHDDDGRIMVTYNDPYRPNMYPDNEVLIDDDGHIYHWDRDAGRHLNSYGYDPEGYDADGYTEDGYDRAGFGRGELDDDEEAA